MKRILQTVACALIVLFIGACERPQSPDFKLEHQLQAPLTVETTYHFLGGSGALIDTTSEDFSSLFTIGDDGLIRLAKEEKFEFGDLNGAIPEVDVEPITVTSQVGEIHLGNFSSGSMAGTASFEDITGENNPLQYGDYLSGASTPGAINIPLDTDYFGSATVKNNGSLVITLTNNLGFDLDDLTITLNSGTSNVGSTTIYSFIDGKHETCEIPIPAGTYLSGLNVDISAGWSNQNMKRDAGALVVDEIQGKDLVASQVTAAIGSQNFSTTGQSAIDDSRIKFTNADHFVELSQGKLSIDITNEINVGIENLKITFPDIRSLAGAPLTVDLSNIPSVTYSGQLSVSQDLSGYRIYAQGNKIDYEVDAITENTQQGAGSAKRTLNENDILKARVAINGLEIKRAKGVVAPRDVLLNDDAPSNGTGKLDVFNDQEAEVISIGGISDLSERISNIIFADPLLSMIYETNLTANATVYAVIAGINSNGNTVYLNGKPGSKYNVSSSEIPSQLMANGRSLDLNQLISFDIRPSENGSTVQRVVKFDSTGTNISEFFNNLPSKIRFTGIAEVNEDGGVETITAPVAFDSRLNIDLPLHFSAQNATFTDTLEADLSDLPGEGDNQVLTEATFTVSYTNGLPFGLSLSLIMLDENGNEVAQYPNSKNLLKVQEAAVNPTTGFVEDGGEKDGKVQISLTDDQLLKINRTRSMIMRIDFDTSGQNAVKVRPEDSVSLRIKMSVDLTSTVN